MRTISSEVQAILDARVAVKPLMMIGIVFEDSEVLYCEKDVNEQIGRIVEVTGMLGVAHYGKAGSTNEITIKLDDTDGELFARMQTLDLHKRVANVYLYFDGTDPDTDKVFLYAGVLTSPIEWDEGARLFTAQIMTQLEDCEFGFTPDEGVFPEIDDAQAGKPWPMCFGEARNVPAVNLQDTRVGVLLNGFGIPDFTLPFAANGLSWISSQYRQLALTYYLGALGVANEEARDALTQVGNQYNNLSSVYAAQAAYTMWVFNVQSCFRPDVITVGNGEKFPRGNIVLDVGGARVYGYFIEESNSFKCLYVFHPELENFCAFFGIFDEADSVPTVPNTPPSTDSNGLPGYFLPFGNDDPGFNVNRGEYEELKRRVETRSLALACDWATQITTDPNAEKYLRALSCKVLPHVELDGQGGGGVTGDQAGFFWADGGTKVSMVTNQDVMWVVSITPGEVKAVKAYRNLKGIRTLCNVATNRYEVFTRDFGKVLATIVKVLRPMSAYPDEEWEDQIYVDYNSTVGPNFTSVFRWFTEYWSTYTCDPTSLATVAEQVKQYPCNFYVATQGDLLPWLEEIAFQARCAFTISGNVIKLKYLPAVEAATATLNEDNVGSASLAVYYSDTEDLVTKLNATWWKDYSLSRPEEFCLRRNVNLYGLQRREVHWTIYTDFDCVRKSATYWMHRWSTTWKRLRCRVSLTDINIEPTDTLTLDFDQPYIATGAVVGIVDGWSFDAETCEIDLDIWTPVKAGGDDEEELAFPAEIPIDIYDRSNWQDKYQGWSTHNPQLLLGALKPPEPTTYTPSRDETSDYERPMFADQPAHRGTPVYGAGDGITRTVSPVVIYNPYIEGSQQRMASVEARTYAADGSYTSGAYTLDDAPGNRSYPRDRGDPHPSDLGDVAFPPSASGDTITNAAPTVDDGSWVNLAGPSKPALSSIFLHGTQITDEVTGEAAPLSTFFQQINGGVLCMKTFINIDRGTAGCAWGEHRTNYFAPEAAYLFVAPEEAGSEN